MTTELEQCVQADGTIRLPLAGSYSKRAVQIPVGFWLGLSDDEIADYALSDAQLFPLVWGLVRPRADGRYSPAEVYFLAGRKEVNRYGEGWRRVRSGVATMRRYWVSVWSLELGLRVADGDGLAARIFNAELFRFFSERLEHRGATVQYELGGVEGVVVDGARSIEAVVTLPVRVPAVGWAREAKVRAVAEEASTLYDGWLASTAQALGPQGMARWMGRRYPFFVGGLGLPTGASERALRFFGGVAIGAREGMTQGALELGLPAGDAVVPEKVLGICRRALRVYVAAHYPRLEYSSRASGVGKLDAMVGAARVVRFGTKEVVGVEGIEKKAFYNFPVGVQESFASWAGVVAASFRALCSAGASQVLEGEAKEFFGELGFRFEPGLEIRFVEGWPRKQVQKIVERAAVKEDAAWCYGRLATLVRRLVDQHMEAGGLRLDFRVELGEDSLFGSRPELAGGGASYWEQVEDVAAVRLGNSQARKLGVALVAPPESRSIDWGDVGDRRSFSERWLNEHVKEICPSYWDHWSKQVEVGRQQDKEEGKGVFPTMRNGEVVKLCYSWLQGTNEQWAKGVVCLEGAMRAYLRGVGFGILSDGGLKPSEYGEGKSRLGGVGLFWQELGVTNGLASRVDMAAVPSWRWYLLREAYLAAYVWAWAEFLYGDWSPLNFRWKSRFRRSLSLMSGLVGVTTRPLPPQAWEGGSVPAWEGLPLGVDIEKENLSGATFLNFVGLDSLGGDLVRSTGDKEARGFLCGGKPFQLAAAMFPSVLKPSDKVHNYPVMGGILVSSFRGPGWFEFKESDKRWHVVKQYTGTWCYGLGGWENGRAFQLLGNWFVTGQSRYMSLLVGQAFQRWCNGNGVDPQSLPVWGQFGLLNSEQWLSSVGMTPLFEGATGGGDLEGFGVPMFSGAYQFDAWVKLGKEALRGWSLVEQAPLSYPMTTLRSCFTDRLMAGHSVAWLDRVLRGLGHGVDPVQLSLPLVEAPAELMAGLPASEQEAFTRWRERIWAPLLRCDLKYLPQRPWNETEEWFWPGECFSPTVEALWRDWVRPWAQGRPERK